MAAAAVAAFYLLGSPAPGERSLALSYVSDWQRHDYAAMWATLTPASQRRIDASRFAAELRAAAETATLTSLQPRRLLSVSAGLARVRYTVRTSVFGDLGGRRGEVLRIPLDATGPRVVFSTSLLLPGLHGGERLTRHSTLGRRGTLLAADGQVLARGSSLSTPIPSVATQIVGQLGPIPSSEAAAYARQGYPRKARVALDGLEQIFQRQLAGRPGGELLAGRRVLARVAPVNGATVRTTIIPSLELDVANVLGGRYGGITVLDPSTGAVEAAVGIAWSDAQPPGSTFKIVTVSAALQAGITSPSTTYPNLTHVVLDGFKMQNAAGERCGGTLVNAFAVSCDTTFAPLGARLGGPKLVAMARRFGFDEPTGIPGTIESTIPSAATIGDPLAVGASAIGQGRVLASTLQMADVAATIADAGRRPLLTMRYGVRPRFVHVISAQIAGEVQTMMEDVISYGTGTSAQIPGVTLAGKTGTAELRDTAGMKNPFRYTDSWFVAYGPVGAPKVAVCALYPGQGYGAQTAAPAVKRVIEDALALGG